MSFWDHLEELRRSIMRVVLIFFGTALLLFLFKNFLFDSIVLAPARGDSPFFRLIGEPFSMSLVNLEVAAQFMIHMKVTFICALVLVMPYIIYEVWKFISPALYANEKSAVKKGFMFSSLLFYAGVAVGYFVVFPVMLYFFANYQVSDAVPNTFSLSSYISLLSSIVMIFGLVFEFPTVISILSGLGIVTRNMLRSCRRYALCVILILAAVITPTGDPFSLIVCSLPLYLLYEFSIFMCREKKSES